MGSLLLMVLFILGMGAPPATTPSIPIDNSSSNNFNNFVNVNACYNLEENTQLTLSSDSIVGDCKEELADKTFIRLRTGLRIINAKISEGKPNWGTCETTEPTGFGALRKVGPSSMSDTPEFGDIFWEDLNYQKQDMKPFILVLTKKDDKYHTFDVYINQELKNNIPEFVTNCKETGGLIPVLEGPATATFPPQTLSFTDIEYNTAGNQVFNNTGYEEAYEKYLEFIKDSYFMRIEQKEKPDPAEQIGVLDKTIQGETRQYDVYFHAGIIYLVEGEGTPDEGKSWMYNPTDVKPPLVAKLRNPTLQLAAMKFISTSEWTWATPECKPAIYLYPEKETNITLKVKPQGRITVSIPEHGQDGWNVAAYPSGRIEVEGKEYSYLYYETELNNIKIPESGWIVESTNLEYFFSDLLPKLGLSKNEITDFKDYWLDKLNNYAKGERLFIGLMERKELDKVESIDINPKPDQFIRVRFYFEKLNPLKNYLTVETPQISQISPRSGFTAVDWGGLIEGGSCGVSEVSQ